MAEDRDKHEESKAPEREGGFKRKVILVGVGAVVAVLAWLIGAAVIPRWWSQRVGDVVDGRLTFGSLYGLAIGFVFTIVPLIILRLGWRFRGEGYKRALIIVAVSAATAFPNLATLGIVFGNGNAAHAGERTLDTEGPGFRGGSLLGAIAAVALAAGVAYLVRSRRANKAEAKRLKAELKKSS